MEILLGFLANANPAIIGDNGGNDKGGNDGGKWESTFAAPIVVVGNPSVIVLIKNAVIAVVIILSGVITSIVVGVAAFVILISVVIGGLVCISVVVDTKVIMLIKSSVPSEIVSVKLRLA